MKRIALVAAATLLALPAGALAGAPRARTFNARVLRSDALRLVLRRQDGRRVTFSARQIAALPSAGAVSAGRREPLAHMATGRLSAPATLAGLDPGVVVRVTEKVNRSGTNMVSLAVPPGVGTSHRARGFISAVSGGSFLLDASGGLELRLQSAVGGLRACEPASVIYHQDGLVLVADRVGVGGPSDCAG